MISDYYYYHSLSKENQTVYKKIYDAALKFEDSVKINGVCFKQDDFNRICEALLKDNPYLYYLNYNAITAEYVIPGNYKINISYLISNNKRTEIDEKIKRNVLSIIEKANITGKSQLEIVKSIHDILVTSVTYDYIGINKGLHEIDGFFAHSMLGVFLKKVAVCDGISKAFKYLLNALDIHCLVVYGKSDTAYSINDDNGHAWNIIKIDNKNYHVDVTWDIAETNNGKVSYKYFCLNDTAINYDHKDYLGPVCTDIL